MYKTLSTLYNLSLKIRTFFWSILGAKIDKNVTLGKGVLISNPKKVQIGKDCKISHLVTLEGSDTKKGLKIGENVGINRFCWLAGQESIVIEDNVQIATNVTILSSDHLYEKNKLISKQGYSHGRIIIKNDCRIGANCVILPGVTLGKGSIIAANAVVTKDVEDYTMVGGVPAKFIKHRT